MSNFEVRAVREPPLHSWISDPHRAGWGLYGKMIVPPATVFEYLADKTDLGSEFVSIILEI